MIRVECVAECDKCGKTAPATADLQQPEVHRCGVDDIRIPDGWRWRGYWMLQCAECTAAADAEARDV